jgi:hypothetical protein
MAAARASGHDRRDVAHAMETSPAKARMRFDGWSLA